MTAITQKSVLAARLMTLFMVAGCAIGISSSKPPPFWVSSPSSTKPPTVSNPPVIMGRHAYDTRLILDLSDRVAYVYYRNQLTASYRVAIGQKGWQTPIGQFRIRQMISHPAWQHPLTHEVFPPGKNNPLGDRWIGFTADESMQLGFHGTQDEQLIGQAVSHGCVRMRNRDVRDLYDRVSLGTLVVVRP